VSLQCLQRDFVALCFFSGNSHSRSNLTHLCLVSFGQALLPHEPALTYDSCHRPRTSACILSFSADTLNMHAGSSIQSLSVFCDVCLGAWEQLAALGDECYAGQTAVIIVFTISGCRGHPAAEYQESNQESPHRVRQQYWSRRAGPIQSTNRRGLSFCSALGTGRGRVSQHLLSQKEAELSIAFSGFRPCQGLSSTI
jgi:hypothetical protein